MDLKEPSADIGLEIEPSPEMKNGGGEGKAAKTPLAELSPAAKAQRDKLFEGEMMPHIKSLYHFAYRLAGDEENANDLVQDTYLKAYRFFDSYEQGSNAKAWLFRILKNSFINNYRKTSKEPGKVDYEEAETYLNTGKAGHVDSIDMREKIFRGMVGDEITNALNRLPVDFRTVIILCDIEEFTYEEIAKIIDIPIGTVRSRLHRARKMLRDMLLGYAVSMGYDTSESSEDEKDFVPKQ